ncbi:lysine transporter LysE [Mangrovactinospora gilvigrisea]|uniref:Lysine transporter LysE n=1 Tax=Mangrovactinospora gilvigrisea TaxID=1428644 RepID=A0A1J7BCF1_9ACTN|nr:LysE family translocator [Mangrovactinospora gilvigrisea]OIV36326.1 lysine transporter LysE [Mangrovactinospora gilvigrisea]
MPPIHALAGVAAVSLGMVLTPGPNMLYLVSRSLTQGRRAGLTSLAGVVLGFLAYLTATALGLSAVFTLVPGAYLTVKLAGACYLGWMAWQALRPGGTSPFAPRELPRHSDLRLFAMGLTTCLLNPKIAIMYLSLLPQFTAPSRGHLLEQNLLLGLVQVVVGSCVNGMFVLAAGAIAAFLGRRPGWLKVQRWVMGTVLGGLAVRLATDSARPTPA